MTSDISVSTFIGSAAICPSHPLPPTPPHTHILTSLSVLFLPLSACTDYIGAFITQLHFICLQWNCALLSAFVVLYCHRSHQNAAPSHRLPCLLPVCHRSLCWHREVPHHHHHHHIHTNTHTHTLHIKTEHVELTFEATQQFEKL